MKNRCTNKNQYNHKFYASVTICKAWWTFAGFLKSMGIRPEGTTLGRKLDMGNYEPSNCAWMTPTQQRAERAAKKLAVKALAVAASGGV
jgi:hypothetical protein